MIPKNVLKALDEQIALEFDASSVYLAMSAWAEAAYYPGFAKYLRAASDEEREHGKKIVDYVLDRDEKAVIPAVKAPADKFGGLLDIFRQVKALEERITVAVNDLATLAVEAKDWPTHEMLQWFMREQVEAVKTACLWVARLERAGKDEAAILFLDEAIGK